MHRKVYFSWEITDKTVLDAFVLSHKCLANLDMKIYTPCAPATVYLTAMSAEHRSAASG